MAFIRTTNYWALLATALLALGGTQDLFAATAAQAVPKSFGELKGSLIVVLGCGEAKAPEIAAGLGASGNSVVHAVAGTPQELKQFNEAIAKGGVKGCVAAEQLELASLPYRDYMVNTMVIMNLQKAQEAGLKLDEARRCLAPDGKLVTCSNGKIDTVEVMPLPEGMDVWTHRYYRAHGIPASQDQVFDLPVGFKWNAGLPMYFDNPKRSANRYSSTRALVVDDGRCFTFSTAVYENLGPSWRSEYGTGQYLTCRDAFNGRLLWRKRIGDTYYGGLYIENTAPLVSTGRRLYLAGDTGKMAAISTRTGETVRELPTTHIPGVIASADGVVVAATWKEGKVLGSIERYDRRRMDWTIDTGTIEAYDDETGKLLWKNEVLGTSLLIAEGRVYIVSRTSKDDLEKAHNRMPKDQKITRPSNKVIAMDLAKGTILWQTEDREMGVTNQTLSLEAAGFGAVAVAYQGRSQVKLLSAATGKLLDPEATSQAGKNFFRYRNHICTPAFHVNQISLTNRGGSLLKEGQTYRFGGARAACLTGTVPAYGAGYIAQNWCNCSPGQIPGLMAIAPIGTVPSPEEMEQPAIPVVYGRYDEQKDGTPGDAQWTSFRGNAKRSSSSACDIADDVDVIWSSKVAEATKDGTVTRDRRSYLNSRLTAAVLTDGLAIVGDIDHNEIVAVNLKDGSVPWRFATASRTDAAPTIYKGICLIGDHAGYVYAVKVKTGELIYKLRIAPDEKRMLSYGRVESVWPVIGGVMVANGKAYASAGRTQGSDGGLIVRAFTPETGKHLWAKALPQTGNGVIESKPRRNDAIILDNGLARIMDHRLNPDTGEICQNPLNAVRDKAIAAKQKELGRDLNNKEKKDIDNQIRKDNPAKEVSMGNEGFHSWNWTRLGHRKFHFIGYAGRRCEAISWNDKYVAGVEAGRGSFQITAIDDARHAPSATPNGFQITSLVLCNNVVVQGGAIIDQGGKHGLVRAVGIEDGKTAWEKTFDAPLAFNGLAVDRGQIIASFDDGTVAKLK